MGKHVLDRSRLAASLGLLVLGLHERDDWRVVRQMPQPHVDLAQRDPPGVEVRQIRAAVNRKRALDRLLVVSEEPDEG